MSVSEDVYGHYMPPVQHNKQESYTERKGLKEIAYNRALSIVNSPGFMHVHVRSTLTFPNSLTADVQKDVGRKREQVDRVCLWLTLWPGILRAYTNTSDRYDHNFVL